MIDSAGRGDFVKYGLIFGCVLLLSGCALLERLPFFPEVPEVGEVEIPAPAPELGEEEAPAPVPVEWANVVGVEVTGQAGSYSFAVTVSSPDTGCEQYADWWEVLSEDGELLYRRVLLHSHVGEQPFARSGGPVPAAPDQVVWVRAHMHPGGYGGAALGGTVDGGFEEAELSPEFAAGAARQEPLPDGCAF